MTMLESKEESPKRNIRYKEEPNGSFKTEKYSNRNTSGGLNNRVEGKEERNSELADHKLHNLPNLNKGKKRERGKYT